MDTTLILIDSDDELLRARALVDQLWNSNDPANVARLEAQARRIAAYEEIKWRRPPSVADLIATLMDPGQCRDFVACSMSVARAALGLVLRELAAAAKVTIDTVSRLERGDELKERTIEALQLVLEAAGIEFIDENGDGPGLRLRISGK